MTTKLFDAATISCGLQKEINKVQKAIKIMAYGTNKQDKGKAKGVVDASGAIVVAIATAIR